jgi:carboxypeptidase family protein/TonB-dependent receptor-like protein
MMINLLGKSSSSKKTQSKSRSENQQVESLARPSHVKPARLSMILLLGTLLAVFSAVFSAQVLGQAVDGTLLGTVTDTSGAAVAGAKVSIKEANTSVTRTMLTNESGNYTFPTLTPGTYDVTVEKTGFKKAIRQAVEVLVNTTVRADMQIEPGTVSEEVVVTAEIPLLQTDRSDTGGKLVAQQLEDLPISYNNHNVQGLLNLVPGTTRAFRPHSQFFNPQDSLSTQVNGNSRLANNLQLEGIDDNERTGLLQVYIPPMEVLQTVDVSTSNYEAELGRAGGAVTNLMLKSGTNSFHGAVYAFNKLSALQALSFFQHVPGFQKPVTVYNYDGFNVGGPIFRNKFFFFGDFLRISDHRGQFDTFTLPTANFRAGDFSSAPTIIYDPATGNPDGTGRTQFVASSNPSDPNYNPACTVATGCPNIIPIARFDPISLKLLALVPLPNIAGAGFASNFFQTSMFIKTTDSFDIKMDYNPNLKNHISGRLSFQKFVTTDPPAFGQAGGPHGGGFQGTGIQKTWVPGVNWDHIFSSRLVMELRVGVERYRNDAQQSDYGKNDSANIGIPGVNTGAFTSGLTTADIANYSFPLVGYSASLPWVRAETNIDFMNHWTKTVGNHTVKWGADIRRIRDDLLQTQTFNPRGTFQFREGQTSIPGAKTSFANDFASFLLDVPNVVGRDLPVVFPAYRQWWFFFYGSDKWQLTPKLTADLGVRWDLYPPATPGLPGGFSNYDPDTNNLVVAGIGGNPMNLGMQFRKTNFAPRTGLAYRLTDKTVVRAGFGIGYEPYPDNTYAYNFPVKQNNAFQAANSFTPAVLPDGTFATFAKGFPAPLIAAVPSNGIIPANTPLLINQAYFVIPKSFKNPYVESWNLAVQRVLPKNFTFETAYVGNHGVDIATQYNLNAATIAGIGSAGRPLFQKYCITVGTKQVCRSADTTEFFIGTSNNYNALQVKFDHRSSNLLLTTAYTYGKSLGITDEDGGFTWYINPRRSYARAGFDRTHTFVQSYVYSLPFGKGHRWLTSGVADKLLGGWELTSILTLMTGTPMTFGASGSSLNTPGNAQTANLNGPFTRLYGIDKQPWFDTSVFSQPTGTGVFGNTGRNVFSGPGFFNLDAAAFKRLHITERFNLEFRSEWFSATNTPQFDNPNTSLTSSNFGLIKGAGGARSIDFGLTLSF